VSSLELCVGNKSGNKEEGGIGRINGRAAAQYLRQILLYFLVVLLTFYSTRKSKKNYNLINEEVETLPLNKRL
jgi:CHASE3 domain sensor protein